MTSSNKHDMRCHEMIMADVNHAVTWWFIASWAYYQRDISVISDDLYDHLCEVIDAEWDRITSVGKNKIDRSALPAKTAYYLSTDDYDQTTRFLADIVIQDLDPDTRTYPLLVICPHCYRTSVFQDARTGIQDLHKSGVFVCTDTPPDYKVPDDIAVADQIVCVIADRELTPERYAEICQGYPAVFQAIPTTLLCDSDMSEQTLVMILMHDWLKRHKPLVRAALEKLLPSHGKGRRRIKSLKIPNYDVTVGLF